MALYTTVISGTNSTMSFYLNGKQVGDATYTIPAGGLTNYGDLVAYIGKSSYADPNSKLDVDDYAVYDTAISAADVTKLYDAQVLDKAEALSSRCARIRYRGLRAADQRRWREHRVEVGQRSHRR